jgi:predicted TIM-barrel fold metal-dependent hydrolase
MTVIDADAHVIETEQTWEYMVGADRAYRPEAVVRPDGKGGERHYWLIDGRLRGRLGNVGQDTPQAAREMADIPARLRHMDVLGVDVQVLYPSIYTSPLTERPEVDVALCRGYNRWLADIWTQAPERLRWVMVPPLLDLEAALAEVRFAKEHGACAVLVRGLEGDRLISDASFFPLYEEASRLDLPIVSHAGTGSFAHQELSHGNSIHNFKFPVVGAMHALVIDGVTERFPTLRFGFIEASAQWVPWLVHYLSSNSRIRRREPCWDLMREHRLYVTCQTDDDLPYVLRYAGEDNLLIGTDYGHADTASELEAFRHLKATGAVAPAVIDKILDDNPRNFYGL